MTGFGRAVGQTLLGSVTIELRSVNHRYLDVSLRTPRDISFLEEEIKALTREHISRGRVDVAIRLQSDSTKETGAELNAAQISSYLSALKGVKEELGLACEIKFEHLLSLPGVLVEQRVDVDEEQVGKDIKAILTEALVALVDSRQREGAKLAADILERLKNISQTVEQISDLSPQIVESYRKRLKENIQRLLPDITVEPGRLEVEIALFADRSNVTEELVRLRSHLENFQGFLASRDAVGRKMDFYLQELNREINTVGSKAPEVAVSQRVVEIKSELEKIREQVQNLE